MALVFVFQYVVNMAIHTDAVADPRAEGGVLGVRTPFVCTINAFKCVGTHHPFLSWIETHTPFFKWLDLPLQIP